MEVRNMENNISTNKLVYQKPKIELVDFYEVVKSSASAGDDGFGGGNLLGSS
jgi:phage antirepressor YoqD-like protein